MKDESKPETTEVEQFTPLADPNDLSLDSETRLASVAHAVGNVLARWAEFIAEERVTDTVCIVPDPEAMARQRYAAEMGELALANCRMGQWLAAMQIALDARKSDVLNLGWDKVEGEIKGHCWAFAQVQRRRRAALYSLADIYTNVEHDQELNWRGFHGAITEAMSALWDQLKPVSRDDLTFVSFSGWLNDGADVSKIAF